MRVFPYNELYYRFLSDWLTARELHVPEQNELPYTGFVVLEDRLPISIAFLRQVEGGFAQIDGLVTNPECSKELRNEANDLVTSQLIKTAKELGLKGICSYSSDSNTLERAKRHGFKELDHKVIVLNLKDNTK